MSTTALFRKEVFEARRDAWLGRVQLVQPLPVRLVAWSSLVLAAACAVYLYLGTYTRRVHASGMLVPQAGLITVSAPAAGIIGSSVASEGLRVTKGQVLYVISLDAHSADGPTQQRVIAALREQKAAVERQRDLRRSMARVEKNALVASLQNLAREHAQLAQQAEIETQTIALLKAKADELHVAARRGIVPDQEFESQNYIYMQAVAQRAAYEQSYLQTEGRMQETSAQIAEFDDKLAHALTDMDRSVLQLEQQIAENEAKRSIEVQAPADGTLTAVRIHAGQLVGSGMPLVTLLPAQGRLEADLFVDSAAIGFVEKGQNVLLRYAAFPFQRFGLYRGEVAEVTRAPVGDSGASPGGPRPADPGGTPLYRIVVMPDQAYVHAYGEKQPLEAGMRVDADIALEKQPLYRWLLDPLARVRKSLTVISGAAAR